MWKIIWYRQSQRIGDPLSNLYKVFEAVKDKGGFPTSVVCNSRMTLRVGFFTCKATWNKV